MEYIWKYRKKTNHRRGRNEKVFIVLFVDGFCVHRSREDIGEEYDPINTLLALNMAVVSVNSIVTTQDRIILDQEYKNIINNLSIGDIESDYEIVTLYRELMDVITEAKLRDEDAKRFQSKYDTQQKNAIFNAISGVRAYGGDPWSFLGSLFVSGVSSYFGYREQKAQLRADFDENVWQLEKEETRSFNDLQKSLLQASWALLRKYKLSDKYRITQENLNLLEFAMQEVDKSRALAMFSRLENIFNAYPPFWFFYGDAATRSGNNELALKCFQKFDEAWRPVLRQDPFRVQVARYQITLEKDLTKERISSLLDTINQFTSPTNWMDNLFVGVISYSIGEKEDAKKAVETNILFKSELDISPLILSSMQSGNLNLSVLPGEIKAALDTLNKRMAVEHEEKPMDADFQKALIAWFSGDDKTSSKIFSKMVDDNTKNPVPYYILSLQYLMGSGIEKDVPRWQKLSATHSNIVKDNSSDYANIFEICKEFAEKKSDRAQSLLGEMYSSGLGVSKNEVEAVSWYRKAAEQGYYWAQSNLGGLYLLGTGVNKDEAEAVRWFQKSAEQGELMGQAFLGWCYENGTGTSKDEKEAVRWYRKSAEQGNAKAQFRLGNCYQNGIGVDKDAKEAVRWYRKSAEQGDAWGEFILGVHYSTGIGINKDEAEAARWYRKSAEQGNAKAQNSLGLCYQNGTGVNKDEAEAVRWFRKSAEQGDDNGQHNLAWCYLHGLGVERDRAEAVQWFLKSAEQGNVPAKYQIGLAHMLGAVPGTSKNETEGTRLIRQAAEQGHAEAQNSLGISYYEGTGVRKDEAEAVSWYYKSAAQGFSYGQSNLGWCYFNGNGVSQDYEEAYKWFYLAYLNDSGNGGAQEGLKALEEKGLFSGSKLSSEGQARAKETAKRMFEAQKK